MPQRVGASFFFSGADTQISLSFPTSLGFPMMLYPGVPTARLRTLLFQGVSCTLPPGSGEPPLRFLKWGLLTHAAGSLRQHPGTSLLARWSSWPTSGSWDAGSILGPGKLWDADASNAATPPAQPPEQPVFSPPATVGPPAGNTANSLKGPVFEDPLWGLGVECRISNIAPASASPTSALSRKIAPLVSLPDTLSSSLWSLFIFFHWFRVLDHFL